MVLLPHAGLPGSDAFSFQLLEQWRDLSAAGLLLTALLRVLLIAALPNLGWTGGPFLSLVYSAICFGFGMSDLFGIDVGVCVAAAMSGILVSFSGQPFMGIAAIVCCPMQNTPIIAVSIAVAAALFRPKGLKGEFASHLNRTGGPARKR